MRKFEKLFKLVMQQAGAEVPVDASAAVKPDYVFVQQLPVQLKAIQLTEPTVIHSLEGDVQGNVGDWLLTGVKGQQWPVRDEVFKKKYEPTDRPDYWQKKPIRCQAYRLIEPKHWTSWNGDDMLAEPGDWMIIQPGGSESSIKDDIFKKTYRILG